MGIVIKKIGKRTVFSIFFLGAFIVAVAARLLFGSAHINLTELESSAKDAFGKSNIVNNARADIPSACSGGCEGGSEGCEGGGCEGSGDGSGDGSDGSGDGG